MEIIRFLNDYKITSIIIVAIIAWLIVFIVNKLLHNFFKRTSLLEERKEQTIESMFRSFTQYTAVIGVLFFAISQFVDDFGRVLAGAGIVGVIVGFGAQSLIKDILAGIFLTYEKQVHKGDFVTINNTFNGTVEDLGLRFLKVREWSGKLLTINNGEVKQIHNYNIERMRVIEKVTVSFRQDPKQVFEVLELTCTELNEQLQGYLKKDKDNQIIEPFQLYGMTSLNSGFKGYEYTVTGLVDDKLYFEASKVARFMIAQKMFEYSIQMAEDLTYIKKNDTLYEQNHS